MKNILGLISIITLLSGACALDDNTAIGEDMGLMPEVVVTAPRYGADIGMMPEIIVTASRYEDEDVAYSGMMPEIVVSAPRHGAYEPYVGALPEIVVTAPRYEGEDIAYSGMMPEVIVVESRYESEETAFKSDVRDVSIDIALIIIRNSIK
ncbi:MAG: hypothetical protein JSV97_07575 [candidate division WOR-3 bacterium]|nr:MAG: hypothetical protein JSV97_07575 [candidate division WOR-3 bacterium]